MTAQYIMEEMQRLEATNFKTIEHYMANVHGIDWNEGPILVELADLLKKLMYVEAEQHPNGYTRYNWYSN